MVLDALGFMNNADFEKKKKSKLEHCARCVYYLSIITKRISNLKKNSINRHGKESPKESTVPVNTLFYSSYIHSARRFTYNCSIALCVIKLELTTLYCSVLRSTSSIITGAYSSFVV